jgi:hypothetical protein
MISPSEALSAIPAGLRDPLLTEFADLSQHYAEHRWGPSELSGGRFCEVVYSILDGYAQGTYLASPKKPSDFVSACRKLEQNNHVPRSFQILIPRLLPALYEIRNNRGVGHVGGDVDPNQMDANAVFSMSSWILAELVRVFHGLTVAAAQQLVNALSERPLPIIWAGADTKVVLNPNITLRYQILLLLSSDVAPVGISTLQKWLKYKNTSYLKKLLVEMEGERTIHLSDANLVHLLPPGSTAVADLLKKA